MVCKLLASHNNILCWLIVKLLSFSFKPILPSSVRCYGWYFAVLFLLCHISALVLSSANRGRQRKTNKLKEETWTRCFLVCFLSCFYFLFLSFGWSSHWFLKESWSVFVVFFLAPSLSQLLSRTSICHSGTSPPKFDSQCYRSLHPNFLVLSNWIQFSIYIYLE